MRGITRVLGAVGVGTVLVLGMAQSASAANGTLTVNGISYNNPRGCYSFATQPLSINNKTNVYAEVYAKDNCNGKLIGIIIPQGGSGTYPSAKSVKILNAPPLPISEVDKWPDHSPAVVDSTPMGRLAAPTIEPVTSMEHGFGPWEPPVIVYELHGKGPANSEIHGINSKGQHIKLTSVDKNGNWSVHTKEKVKFIMASKINEKDESDRVPVPNPTYELSNWM